VDIGMRFFRSVTPRSGYYVNDVKTPYDELTTGLTAGVTYTAQEDFAVHSLGLSFSVATFYGALPFGARVDPYSVVQRDPPRGNINVAHVGYSFSNVEGGVETAGPTRGFSVQLGLDYADAATGSSYSVYALNGAFAAYLPMPWPGHHTLALRTSGAVAGGTYPRTGAYTVGGYDLEGNGPVATILSGVFNGTFAIRGYAPRSFSGSEFVLQNVEYRAPLFKPDVGLSTLPLYLRRVDGALFFDWGGAFDRLRVEELALFKGGQLIYAPQIHSSIGAELWLSATLGYVINTQLRLGYAYGLSPAAIPYGQPYFIAQTAF